MRTSKVPVCLAAYALPVSVLRQLVREDFPALLGQSFSHVAPRPRLGEYMGQCNRGTARLSRICTAATEEPPSHPKLRGLDLLKSCARYYENAVGVATPAVRPSLPLGATSKHPASSHSKWSISTLAVTLLLLSLGIATMWGDFVSEPGKKPRLAVDGVTAVASRLPAPGITAALNLKSAVAAQTPSNEPTDIIVHKVKTQPISGEAFSPDPNSR